VCVVAGAGGTPLACAPFLAGGGWCPFTGARPLLPERNSGSLRRGQAGAFRDLARRGPVDS
jgi:hypothetical protein